MEELEPQITLRDTIAEQFDALEQETPVEPKVEATPETPEPEKSGRTAGRLRDEHGRLLPGKREEVPVQVPDAAKPGVAPPATVTPVSEPRPSSWKKEMWEHWDKLTPDVQKYLNQREREYSSGVSTYRHEYENARPVMEALAPHMPLLQQHGIDPGKQVARYMDIHRVLAMGQPEEKLGLFAQMAQDYKIPIEKLLVQGQDGKLYLNQQAAQQYRPPQPQQDVRKTVQEILTQERAAQAATDFTSAKDASGNPAHPHFETVRDTMIQLLGAGIANDLESAYDAALRLPQHSQLYEQDQQQRLARDDAEKQKKLQEQAAVARRGAVQVKGGTPRVVNSNPPKGIRGALESAFDAVMPGRV